MKKTHLANTIGRKRRTLGWTLLTLGLLVAGVWVASRWIYTSYAVERWSVELDRGCLVLSIRRAAAAAALTPTMGWTLDRTEKPEWCLLLPPSEDMLDGTSLRFAAFGSSGPESAVMVLLWPIPLLLWTPAALLLRSGILARRRAVKGKCAKCGYSLAGLAAGAACPECGKGAKATA